MMGDERLVEAVAAGDGRALRELFDRHAPWLAARLRRTMPAHAVEDVLQETFIAVWRGAKGYKGEGAAGAWIWGIARRQAALWARKNGRPEIDRSPPDRRTPPPPPRAAPTWTARSQVSGPRAGRSGSSPA